MSRAIYISPPGHDTTFSTTLQAMYWNGVYYPNWRIYRDQTPASLNYDVISHVFYAFAWYAFAPWILHHVLTLIKGEARRRSICMSR